MRGALDLCRHRYRCRQQWMTIDDGMEMNRTVTKEVRIRGTVQGVGFRPTVWRLARDSQLRGDVCNDGDGVLIRISGLADRVEQFLAQLPTVAPALSRVESIDILPLSAPVGFPDFRIIHSRGGGQKSRVTADAAICTQCRDECLDPGARRYFYPFTNCTHCGPRFSIVRGLPYDRCHTTMADFSLCGPCRSEYDNPEDRRFHAQPIACPACGPRIWLEGDGAGDLPPPGDSEAIIERAVATLNDGGILALRGLGGFHLVCDARNARAVRQLRQRKQRNAKPFALMAPDMAGVERYCQVSAPERQALQSAAAPVVLLTVRSDCPLPDVVAPGSRLLGFMLPYTPLHLMLCRRMGGPLVMTSGNRSGEPQAIDLEQGRALLPDIADLLLLHDRDIANRIDDSVVRVMAGEVRLLRRARGYAPQALELPEDFAGAPQILAYGGELKATFCLLKDGMAIPSQHQGDLENAATLDDFERNLALYRELYDFNPALLAVDMHPEYLSGKLARTNAGEQGLPVCEVQHHHAHIASCLLENRVGIAADPVLGIALDGLGYGADQTLWGGEFLLADYRGFRRLARFSPVAMIGGAQAIQQPWRNTYAHIVAALGWPAFLDAHGDSELAHYLRQKPLTLIEQMLAAGLNVPPASSCGRLFDAVAAALGLARDFAEFEGQGAMALEALVDPAHLEAVLSGREPAYHFAWLEPERSGVPFGLSPAPLWRELLADLEQGVSPQWVAGRFHGGLAMALVSGVERLQRVLAEEGLGFSAVALSGGCLQNRWLLESSSELLAQRGYRCLTQARVPANDGGLSLGQAAVAAARWLHGATKLVGQ